MGFDVAEIKLLPSLTFQRRRRRQVLTGLLDFALKSSALDSVFNKLTLLLCAGLCVQESKTSDELKIFVGSGYKIWAVRILWSFRQYQCLRVYWIISFVLRTSISSQRSRALNPFNSSFRDSDHLFPGCPFVGSFRFSNVSLTNLLHR